MSKLRVISNILKDQGINIINHIPPIDAFKYPVSKYKNITISLFPNAAKSIFLFTIDDLWEKTNLHDLKKLLRLLRKKSIKGTFFITPFYNHIKLSQKKALEIKSFLKGHELAQHGVWHTKELMKLSHKKRTSAIRSGKNFLEKRLNTKILGYRSPKFIRKKRFFRDLSKLEFLYNSDQFLFQPNPFIRESNFVIIPVYEKCDPFALGLSKQNLTGFVKTKIDSAIKHKKIYAFLVHTYDLSNKGTINALKEIFNEVNRKKLFTNFSLSDFAKWWIARTNLQIKTLIKGNIQKINIINPSKYKIKNLIIKVSPLNGVNKVILQGHNKKVVKNIFHDKIKFKIDL